MIIKDPGHAYDLSEVATESGALSNRFQSIRFVKRFRGEDNHDGILNQELLRVLIDRVQFLDKEVPWAGNVEILKCLRMALVLHEARALARKVEKGDLKPELISTDTDGHFKLSQS